jgi:hypothetical protein
MACDFNEHKAGCTCGQVLIRYRDYPAPCHMLWTLQEKPYDLRGLLQLIENQINPTHQTVTRPIRREDSLRELNISEDEVREIQSAALQVSPGSIVNISGVVTGCPCEDGLGCSDQVWHCPVASRVSRKR